MASLRMQRVRELLKREIGEAIRREFPVSEVGLVTVNDVDVAGDLHSALVFISILGSPEQQKRGFGLLTRHRKRIQDVHASIMIKVLSGKKGQVRAIGSGSEMHKNQRGRNNHRG